MRRIPRSKAFPKRYWRSNPNSFLFREISVWNNAAAAVASVFFFSSEESCSDTFLFVCLFLKFANMERERERERKSESEKEREIRQRYRLHTILKRVVLWPLNLLNTIGGRSQMCLKFAPVLFSVKFQAEKKKKKKKLKHSRTLMFFLSLEEKCQALLHKNSFKAFLSLS